MAAKSLCEANVQKFKRLMSDRFKWVSPWDIWAVCQKKKKRKSSDVVSSSPEFLNILSLTLKILHDFVLSNLQYALWNSLNPLLLNVTFRRIQDCIAQSCVWNDETICWTTNSFLELQIFCWHTLSPLKVLHELFTTFLILNTISNNPSQTPLHCIIAWYET